MKVVLVVLTLVVALSVLGRSGSYWAMLSVLLLSLTAYLIGRHA